MMKLLRLISNLVRYVAWKIRLRQLTRKKNRK